ncbi:MAG: FeoB-associated Cys-rich membrane protein [Deltaproteobacteria bacterium]|nr:FeoB-associated Cys-rich membrane protein [Deltaproteobacteria bacterium]MBM4322369.1 FeoB-associated Cys-rich membrane protein [Deltaproteobacteria bacterium]
MSFFDIVWMAAIIAGALYLLYRSLWKKKGACSGCGGGQCESKVSGGLRHGSKEHRDRQK